MFGVSGGAEGPVCGAPTRALRQASDLARLRPFEPEADAPYVSQTVKILAGELAVPLIPQALWGTGWPSTETRSTTGVPVVVVVPTAV